MTGDAKGATERIERALAERQPVSAEALEAVLLEVRAAVKRLEEAPLLHGDALARRLLDEMAQARDMDEFTAGLERLDVRLGVLKKRRTAQSQNASAQARPRAARTLLKL